MLASHENVYLGMFENGALSEQVDERVRKVRFTKKNYWSTAGNLAKFIRKKQIHVVHNHLYAPMIIASLASLRVKVPVIWHFHGHHFEVRRTPLNILSKLPTVKRIVFVCTALKEFFKQNYHFPPDKLDVVYNSTQCRKLPHLKPLNGLFRIGFIGRVVKLKRIQYLINLAAYFKRNGISSFEVWIVGDGPEREQLENLAEELDVVNEVKFLGFRSDIEELYNQLDLFILPSEEEALSLSLIDAGNVGIPSIAFDVGGNREIVINEKTGYIVSSEEELQQRAALLCRDTELRKRLGTQAEEHTQIFSQEHHLKQLLDIYSSSV